MASGMPPKVESTLVSAVLIITTDTEYNQLFYNWHS